ncbi:hypothetical protein CGCA056_v014022 [Colletotrichum aenigma]|uniref:uncharacterized protein n=1 Tax=Colletotrichum aenigma TaxID=1215731 RepID=UPI0018729CD4|nr:uncharacterized protein CGCA056_v014022 [Colletotrichum aenigma]KAF5502363.1 hypothetical protein CGCA056_v014022 [Colletotrichum aenigma]
MGEDGADSVDVVFVVLVSELLAAASSGVVAVVVDIVVAPRDISALGGAVERAELLLDAVSNIVRLVVIGRSDGSESAVAVGVINGKDIIGVLVVIASPEELEAEASIVAGEVSIVARLSEKVDGLDPSVDDENAVVSVDMSLAVDNVDDTVATSSGSKTLVVVAEDAPVELSVEVSDVDRSSGSEAVVVVVEDPSVNIAVEDVGAGYPDTAKSTAEST